MKCDIGVIGLAVMGQNLVLNLLEKGACVAVYNRSWDKTHSFFQSLPSQYSKQLHPCKTLSDFSKLLKHPAKVLMMVKAGEPVDELIKNLCMLLPQGSLIMDGGNSYYKDSIRRQKLLNSQGYLFLGVGISGGEEGARHGPSMMVGGNIEAWEQVKELLMPLCAKVDGFFCCAYLGNEGAGHLVKMVHNGIEYALMQLIAEIYDLLTRVQGMSQEEVASLFEDWQKGPIACFLLEITSVILREKDNETGKNLLELIVDIAAHKGTGQWTAQTALEHGMPLGILTEAVFARYLSSFKDQRLKAASLASSQNVEQAFLPQTSLLHAFTFAKWMAFAQGFMLIQRVAEAYSWDICLKTTALIWRGGCILKSQLLNEMAKAFEGGKGLALLLQKGVVLELERHQKGLREVLIYAIKQGLPLPAFSSALSFFDAFTSERLPAHLIQAQRDYFGAHTFERRDKPGFHHHPWPASS